ncbi:hypothetical protein H5410_035793 [Solanum commersonii]|uniref:Uncharacterized protein n=1 Tax=Solanum commersonii TaxID=4109 RepID=A0A9J5Y2A9_SOLCO|nr:hypothetical protein H5410_035793 [Solanum commersonii]
MMIHSSDSPISLPLKKISSRGCIDAAFRRRQKQCCTPKFMLSVTISQACKDVKLERRKNMLLLYACAPIICLDQSAGMKASV